MFTHLQVHTHYSLLEAIWSPKAYIEQAKALGMEALACTDYGGMYGAIEFYQAAKKAGIKPLLWVELGYVPDMTMQNSREDAGTIVFLARNYTWYQHLLQLVSEAHINWFNGIPRIDSLCLQKYAGDLIAISWWPRSRLGKLIIAKTEKDYITDQLELLRSMVWPAYCFLSRIIQESPTWNIHMVNQLVLDISIAQSSPLIISGDVHYIKKSDQQIFETALAIKDTKRIYDTDRRLADHHMHLHDEEEIQSYAHACGLSQEQIHTCIMTGEHLVEHIAVDIPMNTILFPIYEPSSDIKQTYDDWQTSLISS